MIFEKYSFPLPNNGDRYDFSVEELDELLNSVYERGYARGIESTIEPKTITASTDNLYGYDIEIPEPPITTIYVGENPGVQIGVDKKFNWFQKKMIKWCFGFEVKEN